MMKMEKKQYICPELYVHDMDVQTMMALSYTGQAADPDEDVLVNEREDKYSDIWGNDY